MSRHDVSVALPNDIITTQEALTILGRSDPSTVSRWVGMGRLQPAFRGPGRAGAFFFHRADVEQFAAELAAERAS